MVVSIGFYAVKGGFFTLITGGHYIVWGPQGTFFTGNNGLAIAVLMVLPLMWFLYLESEKRWVKIALLISMVLSMFTVVASYSRGAFLAAAAVGLYFILKNKHKFILLPPVVALGVALIVFMPEQYVDRLNTIETYQQDGSAMGRINAWHFAWNLAGDRPIVGGGFGAFTRDLFKVYAPEPENFHDAHSIYFEALGEQGFIGLGLFLLLGLMGWRMCNKTRKSIKDNPDLLWAYRLLSMLNVSLVGYAVGGLFLGLAYFDLYYHLLSLIVLTKIIVDKELVAEAPATSRLYAPTT
jgi:probable O-glycosylation ligase (exosortase A-associated)